MQRVEYDRDAICDRLTVATVLAAGGVAIDDDTMRATCPICGGLEESFSIYAGGRRWKCHRGSCGKSGDALDLLKWIFNEQFDAALARAAAMVDVKPGPIDAAARARRATEADRRREQRTKDQAIRRSEAARVSTALWLRLMECNHRTRHERMTRLREYLCHRGVGDVITETQYAGDPHPWLSFGDRRLHHVAAATDRGELALAILDDAEQHEYGYWSHVLVGVGTRRYTRELVHEHDLPVKGPIVAWGDPPKSKMCNDGGSTRGTFGSPCWVGRTSHRCVLVEGMLDFVAAHVVYPDTGDENTAAILGAHSAGMIEHAATIACDRLAAATRRSLHPISNPELVLVTHADDAGRDAEHEAIAAATARGVRIAHHDLGGHKDIAEQVAEHVRARKAVRW